MTKPRIVVAGLGDSGLLTAIHLSRHADVLGAFRDGDRFSSADGVSLDPAATGKHAAKVMSFLAMDDPRHFRMRSLVSKGFTPRRVQALEVQLEPVSP